MYKILSYLLIILIALTGIACASACYDVDDMVVGDNSTILVDSQDISETSDVDLNQDLDDNSADEYDDVNQDVDNATPLADVSDNFTYDGEIKSLLDLSTTITQKDKMLFYSVNPNLNCTGNLLFNVKSGNQTCLDCDISLNGDNSFRVNQFVTNKAKVLTNQAIPYTITVCYGGDANHYPTMLSQTVVVDYSIIDVFTVSFLNEISVSL